MFASAPRGSLTPHFELGMSKDRLRRIRDQGGRLLERILQWARAPGLVVAIAPLAIAAVFVPITSRPSRSMPIACFSGARTERELAAVAHAEDAVEPYLSLAFTAFRGASRAAVGP